MTVMPEVPAGAAPGVYTDIGIAHRQRRRELAAGLNPAVVGELDRFAADAGVESSTMLNRLLLEAIEAHACPGHFKCPRCRR